MKTDLYTKTLLTIIAACLTFNVAKDLELVPKAYAAENNVETNNLSAPVETIDVRIVDINTYDELNVNIKSVDTYDEMKVNIKSIDTSDELDVNIDEIGGSWITNGNPIPVTIRQ
ncbi:hypothetical protein POV27_05740 [Aureisphaera galaxeae]|uniref:hypothetical protein n=1 Tax=Aureisphaera galaxeae TaxID=1538023 RepID=UPI00235054D0|nr:hypothetical protein [Aureisphaera galaxeae]MDC8003543.1 hypothetical protein [Aureisphaera galaxeae]